MPMFSSMLSHSTNDDNIFLVIQRTPYYCVVIGMPIPKN